ncbi:TCR/Tet family MFS transporter [Lichenicoccus roseus]|uniref:TCR/Tet family MFS transporter n=1 Tax=Lichenicoccus roseus TaxID=2683649 RepID=A0A5R9J1I6_9PROT|nr:TCR/Tet family MFS transporter [Lichenicoccus roseus]TLU71402.1 TCR/Tet family MFS transporter [Lichenicoccus roseus]
MTRALGILYLAAFIDATSVGLIIPILPTLLRRLVDGGPVVLEYGLLVAAFAAMQFLFAPVLGALSDRYGRRPIMLLSLAGGTVDYLLTGFAPTLWLLFVARLIGGMTAANLAVVSAMIADLTPQEERAARYGTMNAVLGLGWIAGPALGGIFGQVSPVLPFLLAAGFNGLNLLLALFLLPEPPRSRAGMPPIRLAQLNAFASLHWIGTLPRLAPLIALYAALCLLGQIPGSLWVLYGQARYGWGPAMVGWSFAWFGLLFALAQKLLPGPMNRRLGERRTLLAGIGLDALACALMGVANRGWMPFAITTLFGAGNVGMPALQSAMSREVGEDRQGELQGSLASLNSLASVAGPILATLAFGATRETMPGAVWFVAAVGYLACMVSIGAVGGARTLVRP